MNTKVVTLDDQLAPLFQVLELEDSLWCYPLLEDSSARAFEALVHEQEQARKRVLDLIATYRAAMGLCLANGLPSFGINAFAQAWLARLQNLPLDEKFAAGLGNVRQPAAWDAFHFEGRLVPQVFGQAVAICRLAGLVPNVTELGQLLSQAGFKIDPSTFAVRSSIGEVWYASRRQPTSGERPIGERVTGRGGRSRGALPPRP